ncbi:hypothetical protein C1701_17235 [Actinoalloteichus sp. AHMU CJ021]|nr:hypothetical protein C1701_17235 [Actinoalloteichus sp. AHMU CJ021]
MWAVLPAKVVRTGPPVGRRGVGRGTVLTALTGGDEPRGRPGCGAGVEGNAPWPRSGWDGHAASYCGNPGHVPCPAGYRRYSESGVRCWSMFAGRVSRADRCPGFVSPALAHHLRMGGRFGAGARGAAVRLSVRWMMGPNCPLVEIRKSRSIVRALPANTDLWGVALSSGLSFDVLGPLRAKFRGKDLHPGPARQSALLGVLLSRPNVTMSSDELLGAVWGEAIPSSASKVIPTYIYRLRRVLAGAAVIERRRPGYTLRIDPDTVDAVRFARAAAPRSTDQVGYGQVADALALWRGEPFDGLPGPLLAQDRVRLHQLRLGLLMRRAGLDIAAGDHPSAVLDLTEIRERHPLHEQAACLLMAALYRSGRQAESLMVYSSMRLRLLDELGMEPGEELFAAHQAVLNRDERAIDRITERFAPAATATGRVEVLRSNLPAETGSLEGRNEELDRVLKVMSGARERRQVVAIDGMPGVGKTAFALRLAHTIAADYPDGQYYLDLRGHGPSPLSTADSVRSLLASMGVAAEDGLDRDEYQAAVLRARMANRRILVVLDDVVSSERILPLLPSSTGSTLITVSRNKLLALPATHTCSLPALSDSAARSLLAGLVGAERLDAEATATAQLIQACAGHPLALTLAANRLRHRPVLRISVLARQLASRDTNSVLRAESVSLLTVVSSSIARLEESERTVLAALAATGTVTTPSSLASRVARARDEVEASLDLLVDANLVAQVEDERFLLHPVIGRCVSSGAV